MKNDVFIIAKEYIDGDKQIIFNGLLEYEEDFINIMRMLRNDINLNLQVVDEADIQDQKKSKKNSTEVEYEKMGASFFKERKSSEEQSFKILENKDFLEDLTKLMQKYK